MRRRLAHLAVTLTLAAGALLTPWVAATAPAGTAAAASAAAQAPDDVIWGE
jgi:hypothetical protein